MRQNYELLFNHRIIKYDTKLLSMFITGAFLAKEQHFRCQIFNTKQTLFISTWGVANSINWFTCESSSPKQRPSTKYQWQGILVWMFNSKELIKVYFPIRYATHVLKSHQYCLQDSTIQLCQAFNMAAKYRSNLNYRLRCWQSVKKEMIKVLKVPVIGKWYHLTDVRYQL